MNKGARRKAQFLEVGARLFSQKGYPDTTLNDILDEVGCSKGSFYHHFESKRQVLQSISDQRTQAAYEEYAVQVPQDSVQQLNRLLYFASPLRRGEESYLASMLSLARDDEAAMIEAHRRQSLKKGFYSDLLSLMRRMRENGEVSLASDALVELLWDGYMAFFGTILSEGVRLIDSGGTPASRAVDLLRAARLHWERMLLLPWGSVVIVEADEMMAALQAALRMVSGQEGQLRFDSGYAAPCQQLGD